MSSRIGVGPPLSRCIKKWEIGGVRFRDEGKTDAKDTELVEELTFALAESMKNLGSEVDGI